MRYISDSDLEIDKRGVRYTSPVFTPEPSTQRRGGAVHPVGES